DYTATIDWGDGATGDPGTVTADGQGGFTVSGAHTYSKSGDFTVHVTIKDAGGSTATTAATVTPASNSVLPPVPGTANAVEGVPFTGVVASFTDSNAATAARDFTATIDWGNGHTSAGMVTFNSATGRFEVWGTNTYAEEGTFTAHARVSGRGGQVLTI